jgi:hypothetical protein
VRVLIAVLGGLTLVACSNWEAVPDISRWEDPGGRFTVELPRGWVRERGPWETLRVTRDGYPLQAIVLQRKPLADAFKALKVKPGSDALAVELSQWQEAAFRREGETALAAQTIERAPAQVGGRLGFRLHMSRYGEDGLPLERLAYGVADDRDYYLIAYEAPQLHYFRKHLPAFEAMAASFRLTRRTTTPAASISTPAAKDRSFAPIPPGHSGSEFALLEKARSRKPAASD